MAVQMPRAGLAFVHRLVRVGTTSQRHLSHRDTIVKLHKRSREVRTFSTGSARCNEKEGDQSDPSPLSTQLSSRQALMSRRRRSLSPLERISSLLPQDTLSPEVLQLREQGQEDPGEDANVQVPAAHSARDESGQEAIPKEDDSGAHHASDAADTSETQSNRAFHEEETWRSPTLPGDSLLVFGELLIAEYVGSKGRVEFRKMFQLQPGTRLQSSWGIIMHDQIAGQPAGRSLKTNRGFSIFIRRASLEDYVLYMKRGPAIAYPKVQCLFMCQSVFRWY